MPTFSTTPVTNLATFGSRPININAADDVDYWTGALGCSELALRMAVAEVGTAACDVGCKLGLAA